MPRFSPLSGPVVFVPGSTVAREDGRYLLTFEALGTVALVRALAPRPFVCSALSVPQSVGTPALTPFAPHPALAGVSLCLEGWDLLTITREPVVLMIWPQNLPDYRAPGEPEREPARPPYASG